MHLYLFSLSVDEQPSQNLPGTEQYLPMAMAVFDSSGQNPAEVKDFCDGALRLPGIA